MSREDDKYFTDLDKQLQELALVDWATFSKLIGEDALIAAKICILTSRGNSIGKIQIKLNVSTSKVRWWRDDGKCDCVATK